MKRLTLLTLTLLTVSGAMAQSKPDFKVKLDQYNDKEYYVMYSNDGGELWGCLKYFIPNMGIGCKTFYKSDAIRIGRSLNSIADADKYNSIAYKKENDFIHKTTIIIK